METLSLPDHLVQRILAEPGDEFARAVFADWLDETDVPDYHRWAEFLRLRIQSARGPTQIHRRLARDRAREVGRDLDHTMQLAAEAFTQGFLARFDFLPASHYTVTVENFAVRRDALGQVNESSAGMWRGLPLANSEGRTLLGMVVPTDAEAVERLSGLVATPVVAVRVPGDQLADLAERTFTRAIALVSPPGGVVGRTGVVRGDTPETYLERLLREAQSRGAVYLELVAHADEYQLSLTFQEARPIRWMGLDSELGRELVEMAIRTPLAGVPHVVRATPHGWGVRFDLRRLDAT